MISTRIHAVLDYLVGALLIVAPILLGFATGGPKQWVPILVGAVVIAYSLLTRYELSLARVVPFSLHLLLDVVANVLLIASPWLFGFADVVWWPHVVVGVINLIVVALSIGATRPVPRST